MTTEPTSTVLTTEGPTTTTTLSQEQCEDRCTDEYFECTSSCASGDYECQTSCSSNHFNCFNSCSQVETTSSPPVGPDPTTGPDTNSTDYLDFDIHELGKLRGIVQHRVDDQEGTGIVKFYNIPFAEPMTPENRFTAPVKKSLPLKSESSDWYDARKQGLKCYRENAATWNDPIYGEDCLNLNIYMPERIAKNIQSGNYQEPVPVLIWIHGGGFFLGSNQDDTLDGNPDTNNNDPSKLAIEQNVIVVKLNYRLGSLGFLFLESAESGAEYNGNWSVLDQILAMRWVTDHISKFGGDLTRRTLSGCSAGGQSVLVHLTEHDSPAQVSYQGMVLLIFSFILGSV